MLYKCPQKSPRGAETTDSDITYWSKGLCLIEAKTVQTYHVYHLNPGLICSVAGKIFYKVDLILTKNIFQICHTSRKSTNTIIFFLVSPPNFRSFLSDKYHSHKNRRKRPENRKNWGEMWRVKMDSKWKYSFCFMLIYMSDKRINL